MNNHLLDRQDVRVSGLFRRIENALKTLNKIDTKVRRPFNGKHFLSDNELSETLKISRRTLQEYRSAGIIPYYLICGKVLYKDSEIEQMLEATRKRSIDEMKLL
ncbi:helix-turn-helix domain-containing protein [Bacteroides sp. 224]|uniref:helix-turn-helix domain-containing protein n=1 Tax=Bacteroides sp. 224 TaxID=2302936 RepID=UPI0013D4C1DB|nr:helix-turn-helix domain-containing protein [Bacteroides sp. 224]NDV64700.1 DNA-binding protein [Bacteroides sp. 224]